MFFSFPHAAVFHPTWDDSNILRIFPQLSTPSNLSGMEFDHWPAAEFGHALGYSGFHLSRLMVRPLGSAHFSAAWGDESSPFSFILGNSSLASAGGLEIWNHCLVVSFIFVQPKYGMMIPSDSRIFFSGRLIPPD